VLVLLLIHHLLLDKLGMAPLSPHPVWWLWNHHLLLELLKAHILLILALLLHVFACLAWPASPPSGVAAPIIQPDVVRQCRPWRLHMHSLI
jgi:hypothetical protein